MSEHFDAADIALAVEGADWVRKGGKRSSRQTEGKAMNDQLQMFARQYLKDGLKKLPGRPQEIFKLMYARDNGKRSVESALAMDIGAVVDAMPQECLDHAMKQVERTLREEK